MLPQAEWDQIVSTLTQRGSEELRKLTADPQRRIHQRKRYTKLVRCVVRIENTEGHPVIFHVKTRNISSGGLGFFFSGYLHPQTSCHFAVFDQHGHGQVIPAIIQWCRHLTKNIHECGAQFDEGIEIDAFVDTANTPCSGQIDNESATLFDYIEQDEPEVDETSEVDEADETRSGIASRKSH